MKVQTASSTPASEIPALDSLIDTFIRLEYDLKLAILNDDPNTVEGLDVQIRDVETKIQEYDCKTSHDRKRLGAFLVEHYLANDENARLIPSGVAKKLKELIS